MSEFELKFIVDEEATSQLWTRLRSSKLANGRRRTTTLRSIYLDTPAHALRKAGITLALRRDGRHWVQTVRMTSSLHGGLARAVEVENPAPGGRACLEAIGDTELRDEIIHHVDGASLEPICEIVIERSTSELTLENGTRAELAIDVGEIRAGGRSGELREAEIGLIEGSPNGLFEIAQRLFPEGGLRFSRLSKAARGYLLAEQGRTDLALEPKSAEKIALDKAQRVEQAARDILRDCLDQISTNMVVVRKLNDMEGPHQLRVGLRRLRSAFSAFSSALQGPETTRLGEEARWLGKEVGQLRDLEVVTNEIVRREAETHLQESALWILAEALQAQVDARLDHLRRVLAEARAQRFLIDLARFVETRGWLVAEDFGQTERLGTSISDFAGKALSKARKKVRKRARRFDTLNEEERHELRKAMKNLRYAIEFFSSIYAAKHVKKFLKYLKKLQAVFGDLNDDATVRAILRDQQAADDPAIERAMGWVIGASQARAELSWSKARKLWRDLEEAHPFWK
jgi:inorganic triphosphatase YgiF